MSLMESLIKLHRVDSQVRGLRSRLDSAERYFDAQGRLVAEVDAQLLEQTTRRKQTQAAIANLETESAAADEMIEKFRQDLNSASTVKQYTAVQTEMNTVKEKRSKIDDEILAQMQRVEEIDARIAEIETDAAERRKLRDVAKQQLEERRAEIGARLEDLERERELAAADVPGPQLAVFDELADTYDGDAMATIEEISKRHREYACGECNMIVPFDQVVSLMKPVHDLIRCPACFRILYMANETAQV